MALVIFDTVSQYNFQQPRNTAPLVSVIDLSKAAPRQYNRLSYGFYTIFLKDVVCGDLKYGKQYYGYQEGTLIFQPAFQTTGGQYPNEFRNSSN